MGLSNLRWVSALKRTTSMIGQIGMSLAGLVSLVLSSLDPRPSLLLRNKMGGGRRRTVWEIGLVFWWQTECSHLCVNETAE